MRRNYLRLSALFTGVLVINGFGAFKSYSQLGTSDTVSPTQTFTVTTGNNSGAGSLRQAITDANASPGLDTITFNISGTGIKTITITSVLPTITDPVIIDGTSQPGYSGTPLILIHGSGTSQAINVTAGGTTLKGLTFGNFSGGTDGAVNFSIMGGNIVAGCSFGIRGDNVTDRISADALVFSGISNNRIGGSTPAERNYFGADDFNQGVLLRNGASNNHITGNWFGVAPNGQGIQQRISIKIIDSPNNFVGGTVGVTPGGACTGECNVITGNQDQTAALYVTGAASTGNVIIGNFVGLLADGHTPNANRVFGVRIMGAPANRIGGTTAAERNVISANNTASVLIDGAGANGNIVTGNYIGTDSTGMNRSTTLGSGISIGTGSANTVIGGTQGTTRGGACTGACNVISGNGNNGTSDGIIIINSSGNVIDANYIGLNAAGTAAILNGRKPDGSLFQGQAIDLINASMNTIGRHAAARPDDRSSSEDPANVYCFQNPESSSYILVNDATGTFMGEDCITGSMLDGPVEFYSTEKGTSFSSPAAFPQDYAQGFLTNSGLGYASVDFVSGRDILGFDGRLAKGPCRCDERLKQLIAGIIEIAGNGTGSSDNNYFGDLIVGKTADGRDLSDLHLVDSTYLISAGIGNVFEHGLVASFDFPAIKISDGFKNYFHGVDLSVYGSSPPVQIAPNQNGNLTPPTVTVQDLSQGGVNVSGTADGYPPGAMVRITVYGGRMLQGGVSYSDLGLDITTTVDSNGRLFFFKDYNAADAGAIKNNTSFYATATIIDGSTQTPGDTSAFSPRAAVPHPPFDRDSDGKTDIGVYRPNPTIGLPSNWYFLNSSNNGFQFQQFGSGGDVPAVDDYNGDRLPDLGIWRPSLSTWYISRPIGDPASNFYAIPFGLSGDVPLNGDFDGDRRGDVAVFRPKDGFWYIRGSLGGGLIAQQWGLGTDKLVPADYNGDGRIDLGVFRGGIWYINVCPGCPPLYYNFGLAGDIPTPADFDGDGLPDIAVFRPSSGTWYMWQTTAGFGAIQFGQNGDVPLYGDFDGDGKFDVGVFRPPDGNWYIRPSRTGNPYAVHFGQNGDIPVPSFEARFHF